MKVRLPNRRRCDARTRQRGKKREQFRLGLIDKDELLRASDRCKNWALPGSKRCRLHGGLSTGAKSAEGKQRQAEGRRRWLERLRAEGKKPGPPKGTGGRPLGSPNPSPEIKAQRQLQDALARRAKLLALVRHAATGGGQYRRKRREAQLAAEPEARRQMGEYDAHRRTHGFSPLAPDEQAAFIECCQRQAVAQVPRDPAPDIEVLQDKLRDANDALERARAEVARLKVKARKLPTVGREELL